MGAQERLTCLTARACGAPPICLSEAAERLVAARCTLDDRRPRLPGETNGASATTHLEQHGGQRYCCGLFRWQGQQQLLVSHSLAGTWGRPCRGGLDDAAIAELAVNAHVQWPSHVKLCVHWWTAVLVRWGRGVAVGVPYKLGHLRDGVLASCRNTRALPQLWCRHH